MRTYVYVDAFNLYYGALRDSQPCCKWLNLERLFQQLLPKNKIEKVKYFTAKVGARAHDPDQPVRQQTYLRALATCPSVEVYYGHYLSHRVHMRMANPPKKGSPWVEVLKTEEKGSDVNLATHLVCDAYENAFDVAVLVTNDSDLLVPLQIVRNRLKKPVGLVSPYPRPVEVLRRHASFIRPLRSSVLQASQFPEHMSDAKGAFSRPKVWGSKIAATP